MRYALSLGEKSVRELVNRLYELPQGSRLIPAAGRSSKEVEALIHQAEEALRQANPGIGNPGTLSTGTVLLVPAVKGLNPAPDSRPGDLPTSEILADLRLAIGILHRRVQASVQARLTELLAPGGFTSQNPLWAPLHQLKGFSRIEPALINDHEQQVKSLQNRLATFELLQGQLERDLTAVSNAFEQVSPTA